MPLQARADNEAEVPVEEQVKSRLDPVSPPKSLPKPTEIEKVKSQHQDENDASKWCRLSRWIYPHIKLLAAPVLSAFILSVLVLVRPTSDGIGKYAFLTFPFLHLFFFPSPSTIGSHIETVLFSIIGGVFGAAYAFLATSCSVWIDGKGSPVYDSPRSRGLAACLLVILAFFGGWLSSSVPRLRSAVRISLFNATWIIGNGASEITYSSIKLLLHPTFVTAAVSLLCNLVCWPKSSGEEFFDLISEGFDITCSLLNQTIDDFFPEMEQGQRGTNDESRQESARSKSKRNLGFPSDRLISLRDELLQVTSHLDSSLESSEYEITFGRIPISQHKEHVAILGHIRSWASCGMGLSVGTQASLVARAAGVEDERTEIERDVQEHPEFLDPQEVGQGEKTERFNQPDNHQDAFKKGHLFQSKAAEEISISMFEASIRSLTRELIYSLQLVRTCVLLTHSKSSRKKIPHRKLFFPKRIKEEGKNSKRKGIQSSLFTAAMIGGIQIDADPSAPDRSVLRQRKKLAIAVEKFQYDLLRAQDGMKGQIENDRKVSEESHQAGYRTDPSLFFRNDFYAVSFLMVSLLEVATETSAALRVCQSKLRFWHAHPRPRIWWPLWSWSKDGSTSHLDDSFGLMRHDRTGMAEDDQLREEKEKNKREGCQEEELRERERKLTRWDSRVSGDSSISNQAMGVNTTSSTADQFIFPARDSFDHSPTKISHLTKLIIQGTERFSRRPAILRFRFFLSHLILSFKHSRHLKYAIKLALGVALLSLPSWLPGSPRDWWEKKRGAWLVISYIYVLEFSSGATVRVSFWRIIGTVAGGIIGTLIYYISGSGNPYALSFLLTLFELPISYFILFTETPGIGVVMGVTTGIIPLIPYLGGEYGASVVNLAWTRGYQIALGIFAALIINLTLYPYHARTQLVRHVSRGTNQLQSLYLSLSRQLLQVGTVPSSESRAEFELIENALQTRLSWSRSLVQLMDLEFSLVPKPTRLLAEIIERLQVIADLLAGLRRIRERGLRAIKTEAITNVLSSRAEMVSSILLTFYVVGQALSTRSPLPQFLPSPRIALEALTLALEEQLSRSTETQPQEDDHVENHGGASTPSKGRFTRSLWCPVDSPSIRTPDNSRPNTPNLHHRNVSRTATPTSHSREQHQNHSRDHSPRPKRRHNALFYVLSEHALLADIIGELEALLVLTRSLVGQCTFIETSYLPNLPNKNYHGGGGFGHDLHPMGTSLTHMQSLTLQRELAAHGLGSTGDTIQKKSQPDLLPRPVTSTSTSLQSHSIVKPNARSPLNPLKDSHLSKQSDTGDSKEKELNKSDPTILEQLQEKIHGSSSSSSYSERNNNQRIGSASESIENPDSSNFESSGSGGRAGLKNLFEH